MNASALKGRSLLTLTNFTPEETRLILDLARKNRIAQEKKGSRRRCAGKSLAILMAKPSILVQAAFDAAFGEEGGHVALFAGGDFESLVAAQVQNGARLLGRMYSAIMACGARQAAAESLAAYSGVPVYNGGSEAADPLQALACVLTMEEESGPSAGKRFAFVGDGRGAAARSCMEACAKLGIDFGYAGPESMRPAESDMEICRSFARASGAKMLVHESLAEALSSADAVYVDAWAREGETADPARVAALAPYGLDSAAFARAKPGCIVLHGIPAAANGEMSRELFESDRSKAFALAENRKHLAKTLILATIA